MARLIAVDPGPHTGLAAFEYDESGGVTGTATQPELLVSITLEHTPGALERYYRQLHWLLLSLGPPLPLIIESYHTVGPLTADGLTTLKIIGWLEATAVQDGYPYRYQPPDMRVAWLDLARALPHGTKHEVDAIAHALCALHVDDNQQGKELTDYVQR